MKSLLIITVVLFVGKKVECGAREEIAARVVGGIGVTFYTKDEILKILQCTEEKAFKKPEDQDLLWSSGRQCVLSNSGNKGVQALSMYSNLNNCLKKGNSNVDQLSEKVQKRAISETQEVTDKAIKKISACKKSCDAPDSAACREQCVEIFYTILKQNINKPTIEDICTKVAKDDLTQVEYKCTYQTLVQVMKIDSYQCSKIEKI
ncbi:unnamed protein product [Caenorhabditis angaria]|uniref:DUF19 domain-containing protein n=1 Tax=Caenorhabditis angaria TaxID=860376 RepID=A0A9P1IYQ3_9PELO|nr:unnamed protein product [Caenorhabditis angaria]